MNSRWLLVLGLVLLMFPSCSDDTSKNKKNAPSSGTCGNGVFDPGESCDPSVTSGEGACPDSCSAPACSTATLIGSATSCSARCVVEPIACQNGDGCCPIGCDSATDNDCSNTCGDGTVEGPETCDGDCPTGCPAESCVEGIVLGSAETCSARCDFVPISACNDGDGCCLAGCTQAEDSDCGETLSSCGDGTLDPGELCDGDCPGTCDSPNACLTATLVGAAATCDAQCVLEPVSSCQSGDGCCPMGCDSSNDSDCSGSCGNGKLDGNETCDGNCPTSCNDNAACTTDTMVGSPTNCNVECVYDPLTVCQAGDGCCPTNCTFDNDADCNCTPKTCAQQGLECGFANDTCGQTLDCGACGQGEGCVNGLCDATAGIGAPCGADADCGVDGVTALTCNLAAPGGYCTTPCLPMGELCPAGSGCSILDPVLSANCAKKCNSNSDCRSGYICAADLFAGNICVPGT